MGTEKKVGVIGVGYVGLPLALEFSKSGYKVYGVDVNKERVKTLSKDKRITFTSSFSVLKTLDAIIVCVPTPLGKYKEPDISHIANATKQINKFLRKGQLIVFESTTYPGTTREYILPILKETGLKVGKDFFLAYSPERIDPGNKHYGISNTPKIVGGITKECLRMAIELYRPVISRIVSVTSTDAAEMTKLLENSFRSVNIALVNELALACNKLKLNVWEIVETAATKPYGFMSFKPGPGIGGHCIPVDPHYLSWKMRSMNFTTRFIDLAGEVNSHMPDYVVERVAEALNSKKKSINGSNILILGMAYKADTDDCRESPTMDISRLLGKKGACVTMSDPMIKSQSYSVSLLKRNDLAVLATDHAFYKERMKEILSNANLIVDTRNLFAGENNKNLFRI